MKKGRTVLLVLLSVLLAAGMLLPAFAEGEAVPGRYRIVIPEGKKLVFRQEPSSDSEVLDYLNNGETAEVVQISGGWAMARQNGKFGWFSVKYAELQKKYDCALLLADISSAEASAVDFEKLAAAGVQGVLLRLGVSANNSGILAADLHFADYWQKAKQAGLAVGVWFASSAVSSAQIIKEYEWVTDTLRESGCVPELPVFYRPVTAEQKQLSSAENTLLVKAFCGHVEENGYEAGVYLPADWTSRNWNFDELTAYAAWIADNGDYCNFTKQYDIWQYTAAAEMDGVTGKVGLSYLFSDLVKTVPEPVPTTESPSESQPQTTTPDPSETEPIPEESTTALSQSAHTMGAYQVTKQPGCSEWGEESAYCTDCGKLLSVRLIAPTGHRDSEWTVRKAPTASETGLAVRTCDVCGKTTKMQTLDKTGDEHIHVYGDWEYVQNPADCILNPSETPEGETPADCCTDREKIMKCEDCGLILARYADTPAAHIPAEEPEIITGDCVTDGHRKILCRLCGQVLEDQITPAPGHVVAEWTVLKAPTLTEEGEQQGECSVCHQTVKKTLPKLDALAGDCNGDGKVNSTDARLVLRAAAKLETLEGDMLARADMNADGKVNSADARVILRKAAKLDG